MSDFKKKLGTRYRVTALDQSVSKVLVGQLKGAKDAKEQQSLFESFVASEGITGEDLSDLMYDLQKAGFHGLKKPTQQSPQKSNDPPLVAAIKAGKIDKALGDALWDAKDNKLPGYREVVDYLKKDAAAYGKFITAAEKNAIGFYEKQFGLPITKEVLEHVSDQYILESILFSSVYGQKKVAKDAIEYAFDRLKNPIKAYESFYGGEPGTDMLVGMSYGRGFDQKMDKWFKELDPNVQQRIRNNWKDYGNDKYELPK